MPGQFACQYTNCRRSYNRKEHLVRHEKSHGQLRPFRCPSCSADFYRNDLLQRHVRLSSKCKAAPSAEQQPSVEAPSLEPDPSHSAHTLVGVASAAHDSRNDIYGGLGSSLTSIASREELERLYFCQFHPHWPLLDEESYMNVPQVPELVAAVLIAGLWMVPSREARHEAKCRHNLMMQEITRRLLNEQLQNLTHPSPEYLPYFQSFLVPFIISTYRGTEDFPNNIMTNKHLFDILQHAGVYQQKRIDESSSDPAVRQQYQR
ncbi:hypothetical protein BJ170DRAFT_425181 [Xylariales sp. AK1849]|nr:hypothetical protein BJ170DRAFT_425181 [Xylariales sp. AK1849]